MSQVIKPTVGRKVWFRPGGFRPEGMITYSDQPCDATVVYVWNERLVNLRVTDHAGNSFAIQSVTLIQPGDPTPASYTSYAEWMPYQVGQAAKHGSAA